MAEPVRFHLERENSLSVEAKKPRIESALSTRFLLSYRIVICAHAIEVLADEIARKFAPERIYVFGSYASGAPTEDSDVDLLIVMAHRGPGYEGACRVRLAVDVDFPMDVIVCSPARLKRRLVMGDSFLSDIVERGLVLHDSNDRRVGEQGRRRLRRRLHSATVAKAQPV